LPLAQVDEYLERFGLRLLVRGHSDLANLSLQLRENAQPPPALQLENRRDADMRREASYFGFRGYKLPDNGPHTNVFVRNARDLTGQPLYDLFTLVQDTDWLAFEKTLISHETPNFNMLSVTLASCAFAKPSPPVNSMTCFAVISPSRYR
jgi:hypothetical protein